MKMILWPNGNISFHCPYTYLYWDKQDDVAHLPAIQNNYWGKSPHLQMLLSVPFGSYRIDSLIGVYECTMLGIAASVVNTVSNR